MELFPSQTGDIRGPGSSMSIESGKQYARWREREQQTFIAACETAIAEGHRHSKCFTKHGWDRVVMLFNEQIGHNWSKLQLRNHWDAMRREHKRLSELLNCTGVEYNPCSGRIIASDEWWSRKVKENKEYKDFKDKDVREIYVRYRQLFGDSYDSEKYAVTPTKLCRTGFRMFEDSALDDERDAIPVHEESSGSSDERAGHKRTYGMQLSNSKSGEKRKSASKAQKGKKKKMSARELSYSVHRATSAAEEVVAKMNSIMSPGKNAGVACVEELLAAEGLSDAHRCTSLHVLS